MVPEAHVSHCLPRRLRVKILSKKGDVSYFSGLSERLMKCSGVKDVRVNPSTGSVLIAHDCDGEELRKYVKEKKLFRLKAPKPGPRTLLQHVSSTFQTYNTTLKGMTGGEFDIPSLVFVSLLISGIWQLARGNLAMPAWYTAFYYALGVFTSAKAHVDEYDQGESPIVEDDYADLGES